MNWADWTVVAIVAVSSLISIKRGFVREALSLAGWGAALVVALTFHQSLAVLLQDWISSISLRFTVAFGALFAATLVVCAMVTHLLGELVRMTGLTGTDRVFGMVFGLARGLVVVLALIIFAPMLFPVDQERWWHESLLIPRLVILEDWARHTFGQLLGWLQSLFR